MGAKLQMYQALILGGAVFLTVQHIGMGVGMASLDSKAISPAVMEERKKIAGISYGVAAGLVLLYALFSFYEAKSAVVRWDHRVSAMFFIFFLTALAIYMCIPKEEHSENQSSVANEEKKKKIVQHVHIAAFTMAAAITIFAMWANY